MVVYLKSGELVVKEILGTTTARMFKDLKVGSSIMLSIPVTAVGMSDRNTHACYIMVENLTDGVVTEKTFNQLPKLLGHFVLEEAQQRIK